MAMLLVLGGRCLAHAHAYHIHMADFRRQLALTLLAVSYFATSSAGLIGHGVPIPIELEEHTPPQYEFHYSVHDTHTGDVKDQFEHRHGDYVTGRYSLIEPDGQRRVVEYNADPLLGFTAQVHREVPVIRQLPLHH